MSSNKTMNDKLKIANQRIINLEKENERLCFSLIDNGQARLVRLEKDNFALCSQIDHLYEQMALDREEADKKRKESCRTISQLQIQLERLYEEYDVLCAERSEEREVG